MGSRRTWGKRCLTSFRLFNSNTLFGRARTPGAVRKPVFELNTTEEAQESGLRGRGGGITCLPFLQEALGLARTNSLMSPKLVLHVLIAQGFEVRGQSPVELQDPLIQDSDSRNVPARHRAAPARPAAPAQNGPPVLPLWEVTCSSGKRRATFIRFGPSSKHVLPEARILVPTEKRPVPLC